MRAVRDFIQLPDNPVNFLRLTHVSMWARTYTAKYAPIHEANIIAGHGMGGTLAHPSVPEVHLSFKRVERSLSCLARLGPRMHDFRNHKIYAQMEKPSNIMGKDDVIELSGLLSAAEESESTLTLKLKNVLAEHSVRPRCDDECCKYATLSVNGTGFHLSSTMGSQPDN